MEATHYVFHTAHAHASSAGGVLLLVSRAFARDLDVIFSEIVPGRACAVTILDPSAPLHILACHVHGERQLEWGAILTDIKAWSDLHAGELCCMVGDWNMLLSVCDQIDITTGEANETVFPTMLKCRRGTPDSTQILGQSKPPSWSDHWPVYFHLQPAEFTIGDTKLPSWVAKSSCWSEVLRGMHLQLSEGASTSWRERWSAVKTAIESAAHEAPEIQITLCLRILHAVKQGDFSSAMALRSKHGVPVKTARGRPLLR
eukprot:1898102-Amphidinium_carterae.3